VLVDGVAIVERFIGGDGIALGTGGCAHGCVLVFRLRRMIEVGCLMLRRMAEMIVGNAGLYELWSV
jgi:hypothetical protein